MRRAVAKCQCVVCERYLAHDRDDAGEGPQTEECISRTNATRAFMGYPGLGPGIPLADIRGPESLPLRDVELLGLLIEECGEVAQRVGKLLRWGWKADFAGTSQMHKLEVELGDVVAAIILAAFNGLARTGEIERHAAAKLAKLREDAAGPRQRLRHAHIPDPEGVS